MPNTRRSTLLPTIAGSISILFARPALAQAPLDEAGFVERVVAESLEARIAEADVELARAEERGAGLWPNPSLAWSRESRVTDAGSGRQDLLVASIPLVLSGRLGLEDDAAEQHTRAVEARADRARAELKHRAVRAFASVLAASERRATLESSLNALDELLHVVEERESAGAAAGYDQLRIGVERASIANELRAAVTFEANAKAEARRLLGPGDDPLPPFAGSLAAPRTLPDRASIAELEKTRGDLRGLALEAESRESARSAAARGWVPEPTLQGGANFLDTEDGLGVGYVAGVSLPLPLFDRRQGEASVAAASRDRARAERALLLHTARVRLKTAFDEVASRREQLEKHRSEVLARTEELQTIARAAHRGGAAELLVLVDAERAAREARLLDLELALGLVEAESDLLLLAGAYDAPRSTP
jgi:outer membrane protein, heavy metal efflux system